MKIFFVKYKYFGLNTNIFYWIQIHFRRYHIFFIEYKYFFHWIEINVFLLNKIIFIEYKYIFLNTKYFSLKKWRIFFASNEVFCQLFFLPTINFCRRIFLSTFFYKRKHLVLSYLKESLVYLFDFKFD